MTYVWWSHNFINPIYCHQFTGYQNADNPFYRLFLEIKHHDAIIID